MDPCPALDYKLDSPFPQTLNSRNLLEWLIDCDHKLHLKSLSTHFMSIAAAKNNLINQVVQFADREVDGTPSSKCVWNHISYADINSMQPIIPFSEATRC